MGSAVGIISVVLGDDGATIAKDGVRVFIFVPISVTISDGGVRASVRDTSVV